VKLIYFTRSWTDHDTRFVRAFAEFGIIIGVLTLRPTAVARLPAGGKVLGSILSSDRQINWTAAVSAYIKIESSFAPDVVLAGPLTDCAYIKSQANTRVPWVAQSWAFDLLWEGLKQPNVQARAHSALMGADRIFVDCEKLAEIAVAVTGRIKPKFIMPWGLQSFCNVPANKKAKRSDLGLGEGTVYLFCRGFADIYAPNVLFAAWREVAAHDTSARLIVAGGGQSCVTWEHQLSRNGLASSVRFLGRVAETELVRQMTCADIYVSTAQCDGSSISLLQAMDAGLLPVVTKVGGNIEWLQNGLGGWLVEQNNATRFAAAMIEAGRFRGSRYTEMLNRNRSLVRSRANWPRNIPNLIRFVAGRRISRL
jgi:glycosyltransferase involved in cell wall biosynthesis